MLTAFGYSKGSPPHADKVFDVRSLTHDTKRDDFQRKVSEVKTYITEHPGQSVAVGCEKGQHRSVAIVRQLAKELRTSYRLRDSK